MSDYFGIVVPFENNSVDVWSGRPIDFDAYRYSLKAFRLSKLRVINLTDIELPGKSQWDSAFDFEVYKSYNEFFEAEAGEVIAFAADEQSALDRPIPLYDLEHLTDGWYVFGPVGGFKGTNVSDKTRWSYMPMVEGVRWHPTHMVAAVLWDRQRGFL